MKKILEDPIMQQIIAGVAVAAIVAILGWTQGWWKAIFRRVKKLFRYRPTVPSETLRLIPALENFRCRWQDGRSGDRPIMFVIATLFATNISSVPIKVLRCYLKKPPVEASILHKLILQPEDTAALDLNFIIDPPIRKIGEDLRATIVVVDQFGNEHKIKVTLTSFPRKEMSAMKPAKPAPEPIFSIENPIEKEVVAVLNSEVARYANCGRRVGGLGSVFLSYKGRDFKGVGTDSWTPDIPKNQSLVDDSEHAVLNSDNLDALLAHYRRLLLPEEQRVFEYALVSRLDKNGPYQSVGYFIVVALWRVRRLGDALEKAKSNLQGDNEYAFSNVLMLVDGLLKYKHAEFSNEQLDEIERGISGVTEHTFKIAERIAAIRARRLLEQAVPHTSQV